MRVPRWLLPVAVLSVFCLGVWAFRELGVWRDRGRLAPPSEVESRPAAPTPGGFPM